MTNEEKEYSEQRILAIPADVNEDGQVFYLDEDLGTADDNGLSGEIEMAFNNGYGVALLKVKECLEKKKAEYEVERDKYTINDFSYGYWASLVEVFTEIITELFKEEKK